SFGSLVMPMITLAMGTLGRLTQLARAVMRNVLGQDYVRTAHSKGLRPWTVYYRHALKNASIPLITMVGLNFGYMLGGSVLIESVFAWPGIGRLAAQAVFQRDFPLVQAVAFFGSLVVISANLVTDLVYGLVNPQIRVGGEHASPARRRARRGHRAGRRARRAGGVRSRGGAPPPAPPGTPPQP